jgi:hypothetical protein
MATMPVMVAARRPAHFAAETGVLQEVNERARDVIHHPALGRSREVPGRYSVWTRYGLTDTDGDQDRDGYDQMPPADPIGSRAGTQIEARTWG